MSADSGGSNDPWPAAGWIVQVVTKLDGTLDQVALGHHDVHGEFGPQHAHQFIDCAGGCFCPLSSFAAPSVQLIRGHRDHQSVEGFPLSESGQQGEEPLPFILVPALVHRNGVAAGGVDQNGLFEKPPVAVAGSRNARARVTSAKGEERSAPLMAVVLPQPLSPITMYHGSTYKRIAVFFEMGFPRALDGFFPAILQFP
jgi:hypothetical protein